MRKINVLTTTGYVERYVYNIKEIPWHKYAMWQTYRKHKAEYLNLSATFDIETTTVSEGDRYSAFMFHWQFCIEEHVIFGRYWDEFIHLVDVMSNKLLLSTKRILVIYIHNLPFEFQFMKKFFNNWTNAVVASNGSLMKVLLNGCIELRCSYKLSNMSLQKFCENSEGVTHYKLDGDEYDYRKFRTPETPITEYEDSYHYNDVYGLVQCIRYRLKFDNITTIPLTSTGYVRRAARQSMQQNPKNRKLFLETKLDMTQYILLTEIFRGGDVHANLKYSRQLLTDIESWDMQSAYPACMLQELYPITPFVKIDENKFYRKMPGYTKIFRCILTNVKYVGIHGDPYIPLSKTRGTSKKDRVVDNGRILYAKQLEISLTDIDFDIISEDYTYDKVYIKDLYISKLGPLPDELKSVIMEYFRKKTELKGIKGSEYEYMKSKNELNALYGMMVTALLRDVYEITPLGELYNLDEVNQENQLADYYNNRNSFLPYQWGVYVTTHCRKRLHYGIKAMGRYHVYNDTDSSKGDGIFEKEFTALNAPIIKIAEENGYYAYDRKGNKQIIGVWENEGIYDEFKTLGSKKYITKKNGKIESTIAGVSKKAGQKYFTEHGLESFDIGTCIEESGHLIAYYNEDNVHMVTYDGVTFKTASNVALIDGTYTIGVTNEYLDLLEQALKEAYSQSIIF